MAGADGLLEVLIEIDEVGDAMECEWEAEVNEIITVEVSDSEVVGNRILVERAIGKFERKTAIPLEVRNIIWNLGCCYSKTRDRNEYFASYGEILCAADKPGEILPLLQGFFPVLMGTFHPREIEAQDDPIILTEDDNNILEYIGAFLVRKLYYHPQTPQHAKAVLVCFKEEIRDGSIAQERSRESEDGTNRLWGVQKAFVDFLKVAETFFREHTRDQPCLKIENSFYAKFFTDPSVIEQHVILVSECEDCSSHIVMSTLKNLFSKFIEMRANSYTKKMDQILQGKSKKIPSGLRKYLRNYFKVKS